MFRVISAAAKFATTTLAKSSQPLFQHAPKPSLIQGKTFSSIFHPNTPKLLQHAPITDVPTRTVTKVSWKKGKRKSVKAVLRRFYRLNWGIWVRTIAGRHKRLWTKSAARRRSLKYHVFCNSTQSYMLDKMVGPYWRKPRYCIDDPYEPYHTRPEFDLTRTKPKPYFPPEDNKQ